MLRRLGYRPRVVRLPARRLGPAENDSRRRSQVDEVGWAADYPSPAEFLDHFLSCRSFRPRSATNPNTAELCDARLDRLIERAERRQLTDPAAAAWLWERADRRATDVAAWLPTVNLQAVDFVSRRVGGYQFHPQWGVLLDQLWVR